MLILIFVIHFLAVPELLSINEQCRTPGVIVIRTSMSQFTFRCVVLGVPPPDVQWFVNGRVVASTRTDLGTMVEASFVVTDISLFGVQGNYTCSASNTLGAVSRTIQVVLEQGE